MNNTQCLLFLSFFEIVSILSYAFFILVSTSITRSRTGRLRELVKENFFCAKYARVVLSHADRHLLTCQVGTFLAALTAGLLAYPLLTSASDEIVLWAIPVPVQLSQGVCASIVLLMLCIFGLVMVQLAKAIAFARPNRVLCVFSLPMLLISTLLRPIVWTLEISIGRLLSVIGLNVPMERELAVSAEEISEIVEMSSKAGQIEDDEREMIQHIFTFSDTLAREVMTPRKDIVSVEETASLDEIITLFTTERLSRILVTGANLDEVKGVILGKDLLALVGKQSPEFVLKKFIRPVSFVVNSKKVDELLQDFQREALHFAVVLDEHGGVDGVITIEDLIEEIVGEIFDEFDSPKEDADVKKTTSGDLLVDGSTIIDDLNTTYSLNIPRGEYDTIAGYVIHTLGHIPRSGEQVKHEDLVFRVEEVSQNRITSVRIISKQELAVVTSKTDSTNTESEAVVTTNSAVENVG